jgi:predicted RNase H-like HicB family nuclease
VKIREMIRRLEDDGWYLTRTRGSHRQYHHPRKPGTVTVSGKPSAGEERFEAGRAHWREGVERMQYLVVVEEGENGYGAYVPDLPGCIAAADTEQEVVELIREAIEFHIEGLREHGELVPPPTSRSALVEVHAA